MKIGVIGDDFTGSSDIALTLAQGGMQTTQYVRTPDVPCDGSVEAGVISLKSRSCPVQEAVDQSLEALHWLQAQGCELIIFKYCSTFDSTPQGNIGPVIDALTEAMKCTDPVVVCPAFPATGRTLYQGHLFVFDTLLSDSSLRDHPITPMTDSDLRRWLALQTTRPIGHLPLSTLRAGEARQQLVNEASAGRQYVVCDAVADEDLILLAKASRGFGLLTGGSGIAIGLPALFGKQTADVAQWQGETGQALALSGSCSVTTLAQIQQHIMSGGAHKAIAIDELLSGHSKPADVVDWALDQTSLPLVSTSDSADNVKSLQSRYGVDHTAHTIEQFFGAVAQLAISKGVSRLICAGGETSGAIVQALDLTALEIGPMIDPGVPALRVSGQALTIALKSGNFGSGEFFAKADVGLGG